MKKLKMLIIVFIAMTPLSVFAGGSDDPLLGYFKADKFEFRDSDEGDLFVWEIDAWIGKDLNKFWIKSSGESLDGDVEGHEIDLLYSKAISAFWDLQIGLRHEFKPEPTEDWVGFGFMGVAPYMIDMDINAFINEDSDINIRLGAEYEYMFTQRLVLIPNLELSAYSEDNNLRGYVSGLSDMELGLRLHYEIKREISPYIGINYEKKFGNSIVQKNSDTQLVLGLSFWF